MNENENAGKKQILVLVEGKHEKEILLRMLLRLYPEIPVKQENIHIYESDLYDLYNSIEKEYGPDWDAEELEIDIPKLISMRNKINPPLDGRKFTDIFLMFDFERHDNWYTDEKVIRLQNYFSSALDRGFLFINYPMIEAYQHMTIIPDPDYLTKSVPVSFGETVNYGDKYKSLAKEGSCIVKYLDFYEDCLNAISQRMPDESETSSESIVFQILSLSNTNSLLADIDTILTENNFPVAAKNYLKYYLKVHIEAVRYMDEGVNYWGKMRELFFNVINQNIEKAWHIQNSMTSVPAKSLRDAYFEIDWSKVLLEQIKSSKDQINGKIWILCTCITFLGDYKFFWNHQMPNK